LLTGILLVSVLAPKANAAPTLLFQRTWGGLANDIANGVAVDTQNNTYVAGQTFSYGPNTPSITHAILLKYNSTGGLVWQRLWNGSSTDEFTAVAVDRTTGNIVTVGFTSSFGFSAIVVKFNSTGSVLWEHTVEHSSDQGALGVAIDTSGNIYVTGWDGSGGAGTKVFIMKMNPTGNVDWFRTWGGAKDDEGSGIAIDSYGNVYVTGYTTSFGSGGSCSASRTCSNILLLELDFSGNFILQRIWGGTSTDYGAGIALDSRQNAYIAGYTNNAGAGKSDLVLLKFSGGTLKFQETWGGSGTDTGNSIAIDTADNVYITGNTASFGAGGTNVCLLKLNATGTLLSQATWGGTKTEDGNGIALDTAGNPIVVGSANEAPPFTLSTTGNTTLGTPNFTPSTSGNSTLGMPLVIVGTPAATVSDPGGSQSYAGQQDFFLLKIGNLSTQPFLPSVPPPNDTLFIIVGIVVAAAVLGIVFFVMRQRKAKLASPPKPVST